MKAPEKIYLHHNHKGDIGAGWLMFPLTNNDIEYVRTDTLEVKEVDFGTEVYKYIDEHFNVYDDENQTLQTKDKKSLIGMVDVKNIAKHFFELGLKAQKGEQ